MKCRFKSFNSLISTVMEISRMMSLKYRYNIRMSTGLLLHNCHYQFPLPRIYSVNVEDPQFSAESVTLTEEIINEKLYFKICSNSKTLWIIINEKPNFNHKANPS